MLFSRLPRQHHRLGQAIAKTLPSRPDQSSQGVTLIECLIAILVIGLTASLITPPIFIAVATRAQNRRAEQALQIAQGEVDRIRVMVARSEHTIAKLPKEISGGTLRDYTTPTGFFGTNLVKTTVASATCPTGTSITRYSEQIIDADKALKVDVDGDCTADFFMQVFRTPGTITSEQTRRNSANLTQRKPTDFQLGIRVYSMLADGSRSGNSWTTLEKVPASLGLTNGEGGQRRQPLAVLYTPFSWSDQSATLCDYYQDSNSNALPQSCPARTP